MARNWHQALFSPPPRASTRLACMVTVIHRTTVITLVHATRVKGTDHDTHQHRWPHGTQSQHYKTTIRGVCIWMFPFSWPRKIQKMSLFLFLSAIMYCQIIAYKVHVKIPSYDLTFMHLFYSFLSQILHHDNNNKGCVLLFSEINRIMWRQARASTGNVTRCILLILVSTYGLRAHLACCWSEYVGRITEKRCRGDPWKFGFSILRVTIICRHILLRFWLTTQFVSSSFVTCTQKW